MEENRLLFEWGVGYQDDGNVVLELRHGSERDMKSGRKGTLTRFALTPRQSAELVNALRRAIDLLSDRPPPGGPT